MYTYEQAIDGYRIGDIVISRVELLKHYRNKYRAFIFCDIFRAAWTKMNRVPPTHDRVARTVAAYQQTGKYPYEILLVYYGDKNGDEAIKVLQKRILAGKDDCAA